MKSSIFLLCVMFVLSAISFTACSGDGDTKAESAVSEDQPAPQYEIRTVTLSVKGMMCQGCVQNVKRAITENESVEDADVKLYDETALVTSKPGKEIDLEAITARLTEAGFEVSIAPDTDSDTTIES